MVDSVNIFDPGFAYLDSNGDPVSGGSIEVFDAGTSTPRTVYETSDLSTTAIGTSVALNSSGVPVNGSNTPIMVYTSSSDYKLIFKDSSDVTLLTLDNIKGAVDTSTFALAADANTFQQPIETKSANYSVVAGDAGKFLKTNPSGGNFTLTLLSAVTAGDGFTISVRNVSAGQTRLAFTGGQNITTSGASGATGFTFSGIGHGGDIVSDGANWTLKNETQPFGQVPFTIVDRLATPPGSPTGGARYIVTSSPTGDWSSFSEHDIAEADGQGGWINYTPPTNCGWRAYVQDETTNYQFKSSAWVLDEGYLVVGTAGLRFVEKQTLSSVSEATFTSLSSDYFMYELLIDNLQPATDGDSLYFRTSSDNGSSYDSGASDYGWLRGGRNVSAGALTGGSDADTEIQLFGATIGNAAGEGVSGIIRIYNPGGTGFTRITWEIYFRITTGSAHAVYGGGDRRSAAAVDAVRLFYNTGNIASGDITLVGYRGS